MGCVLQPGDVVPDSALRPGQTTSDAVQPEQEIDICFVAPTFTLSVQDVNETMDVANPNPEQAAIGYELQVNGNAFWIEQPDTGGGPPTFHQVYSGVDWIDDKGNLIGGLYHARMTQNSGDTLDQGTLNTWIDLVTGGGFVFTIAADTDGFYTFNGTVEISDDGGSTVFDSASIILELTIQP